MAFQICGQHNRKCDNLLVCRLKVLLVGGYLVNVGSRQADRYLVNSGDSQVVWWLGFHAYFEIYVN